MESMTLREYRIELGWTRARLAKEAGITRPAVINAEEGETINPETAKKLADTLSRAFGKTIMVRDIEGLNIR